MKLPDRENLVLALRKRRNQILLALLGLALLGRIALPYVLRSVIVSQADAALVGRVELEDIDLSLIRGGVALNGLAVHVDERPSTEPALFEAKRLWTQISWLALFTKTIEIEEFELDGFAVRLDRFKKGLLLPKPVPSTEPPEPEPENPEPFGWSLAADSVAFRDGEIHVRDYTVGKEPQLLDLAVKDLSAQQLALRIDPTGQEPGRVVIQAQLDQGSVGLDAQVTQHANGPGATSTITLTNLPVGKGRRYLALFGWSELTGTLDAVIKHRIEPGGLHQVSGTASLSDIVVTVPKLDAPALAWKKLAIEIEEIDLQKQSAVVAEVALLGARVVVDPKSELPLPVLVKPEPAEAPAEETDEQASDTDVEVKVSEPAKPWTWGVRKVRVGEAVVDLRGGAEPLPVGVDAEVTSISSEPGSRWPLLLKVTEGGGSLGVEGKLAIEPIAFDGKLTIADLSLQPLLSRIDAPAVGLLRQGKARADLSIALAEDLRVSGKLGVAGLDVGDEKTAKEFGVAWKDFELGIRELNVPGLLGARDTAKTRTIGVKLDLVRLVEPAFKITRSPEGIVLPSFGSVAVEPAKPPESTTAAAPGPASAAAAPATEVLLEIANAELDRGRAQIRDRAVKPFYSTRIERLDLRARGVRWPGPRVESLKLAMLGLNGAKLDVSGSVLPGNSKVTAKLVKLPLAQFNSYVTPTGYGLAGGSISLESTATIRKDVYETSTDVVVSQLEVGGSEGESLFQQNFGIPLSVALGLLKDLDGNITLGVPVDGDRGGVKVGLGKIVGQALRSALMGALASPLKLLGAVTSDGKVQLAPEPIVFVPGDAVLAPDGAERITVIAGLLSSSPGIALTLTGGISESDLRVLRERALYKELEATSGVRALGQIGAIATRRAVRLFLEAKLAGKPTEGLEPDEEAWLEEHVATQKLDPAALAALANARAAEVQAELARDHGIAAARISIGAPAIEPPAAQPGVAIGLGAAPKSPKPT